MTVIVNEREYAWLGIDPGMAGAIALLDQNGDYLGVWDMPTQTSGKKTTVSPEQLAQLIRGLNEQYYIRRCTIEAVHAMPKQGVSSSFNFGKAFGMALGSVAAFGIPLCYITPHGWKKDFKLVGKDKDESRTMAQRIWPLCDQLKRKKDVDRAEALLIACSGRMDMYTDLF